MKPLLSPNITMRQAKIALVVAVGAWIGLSVFARRSVGPPPTVTAASYKPERSEKEVVRDSVRFAYTWSKSEYGRATLNFHIDNHSKYDIKDVQLLCGQFGASGTLIAADRKTVFQNFPGFRSTAVKFDIGYVNAQTNSLNCKLDDFTVGAWAIPLPPKPKAPAIVADDDPIDSVTHEAPWVASERRKIYFLAKCDSAQAIDVLDRRFYHYQAEARKDGYARSKIPGC